MSYITSHCKGGKTGISSHAFRVRGLVSVWVVGLTGTSISQVQSWEKVLNIDVFSPSYKIYCFSLNPKEKFRLFFIFTEQCVQLSRNCCACRNHCSSYRLKMPSYFRENVGYMLRGGQCAFDYSCNIGKVGSGGSSQEKERKKIQLWEQSLRIVSSF